MPHGSGLAQGTGVTVDKPESGKDAAGSRDPPSKGHENAQRPPGPSGPRVAFAQPLVSDCSHDPEEEEDDDIVLRNLRLWIRLYLDFLILFMRSLWIPVLLLMCPLLPVERLRSISPLLALRLRLVSIFGSTPGFLKLLIRVPRRLPD